MGKKRNAYGILVGKPEGKGPLGRPRGRWVENIKMDLREIGWNGMERTQLHERVRFIIENTQYQVTIANN
jgi:hypothetical protein